MTPTRTAVVGVGSMGENHAAAVSDHPTLDLDSVVDLDRDRAEEVARRYGANRSSTEYRPAIERADAAIVATPTEAHVGPARAALDSGTHLLLEKPVAPDLETARELGERCSASDLVTAMSFILRSESAYASARTAAVEGRIGDVVAARAKRAIPVSNSRRAGTRGHPLFYMNIHDIDMLRWSLDGRVAEVTGYERRGLLADLDIPDAYQALLRFESGAVATLEGYGVLPDDYPADIDAAFEVVGTDGTASVRTPGGEFVLHAGRYDRPDTRYWPTVNGRMDGAVRRQLDVFADAVTDRGDVLATVEDGVRAQRVAEAVRRAIEGDRPVSPEEV